MNKDNHLETVFSSIYNSNKWHQGSGPGSTVYVTERYRKIIADFILQHQISSVADYGCGDFAFSRIIDWSSALYTGYDIVGDLIARNNRNYATSKIRFEHVGSAADMEPADLLIVKDVFIHLPPSEVLSLLRLALKRFKYILATHDVSPVIEDSHSEYNCEIRPGRFTYSDIRLAPFDIPANVIYDWKYNEGTPVQRSIRFIARGPSGEQPLRWLFRLPKRLQAISSPRRSCEWRKLTLLVNCSSCNELNKS